MAEWLKPYAITHQKKRAFLLAYAETGNITESAEVAKVSRWSHYAWLREDEQYQGAYARADEVFGDVLEAEARRRALKASDTMLIFLLKGQKREKYGDKVQNEQSGAVVYRVVYGDDGSNR
jgi:hypothetical protein